MANIDIPFISLVVAILALLVSVFGLIPLYVDLVRRRRVSLRLSRFAEHSPKPIESEHSIRILHPDRLIERCNVTYDGKTLPWWDKTEEMRFEKIIELGGGGNVRIPKGEERDDAIVVVRDAKKVLKKVKYGELPTD
jgi:hypothetical protein